MTQKWELTFIIFFYLNLKFRILKIVNKKFLKNIQPAIFGRKII